MTTSDIQPSFTMFYQQDDGARVLCGEHLAEEFDRWPEDWSEVSPGAVKQYDYECETCHSEEDQQAQLHRP